MDSDLKQRIKVFLSGQSIANVATVQKDRPHVSALEYVSDDLMVYVVSLPHTQKVANLAENSAVAVAINGPGRRTDEITGVQLFGHAERIDDPERYEQIKTLFFDKYLLDPSAHWFKERTIFYAITPERIDFIDYSEGFGHKDTWTP